MTAFSTAGPGHRPDAWRACPALPAAAWPAARRPRARARRAPGRRDPRCRRPHRRRGGRGARDHGRRRDRRRELAPGLAHARRRSSWRRRDGTRWPALWTGSRRKPRCTSSGLPDGGLSTTGDAVTRSVHRWTRRPSPTSSARCSATAIPTTTHCARVAADLARRLGAEHWSVPDLDLALGPTRTAGCSTNPASHTLPLAARGATPPSAPRWPSTVAAHAAVRPARRRGDPAAARARPLRARRRDLPHPPGRAGRPHRVLRRALRRRSDDPWGLGVPLLRAAQARPCCWPRCRASASPALSSRGVPAGGSPRASPPAATGRGLGRERAGGRAGARRACRTPSSSATARIPDRVARRPRSTSSC